MLKFGADLALSGNRVFWSELRDPDGGRRGGRLRGHAIDGGDDAFGVEVPLRKQAVGRQAPMERAAGDAIEIGDVGADDGAQAIEIEMRVAGFQRVEGPFDEADIAGECFFALEDFEGAANFAIAVFGKNTGHVGVQIGRFVADAGNGHGEADHGVSVEGAEDLTSCLVGDDEGDVGLGFEVGFAPNGFLELDAAVEFVKCAAFSNLDLRDHGQQ